MAIYGMSSSSRRMVQALGEERPSLGIVVRIGRQRSEIDELHGDPLTLVERSVKLECLGMSLTGAVQIAPYSGENARRPQRASLDLWVSVASQRTIESLLPLGRMPGPLPGWGKARGEA